MTTYISILRGINVSGQRIIKMDALKKLFAKLGFFDIQTYIQSGNVVFRFKQSDTKTLDSTIKNAIEKDFGYDVPVITMTIDDLKKTVNSNPFLADKGKDIAFLHITFLSDKPENYDKIKEGDLQANEFFLIGKAVYLYCPNGYSKSKLTNSFLERKLKVTATTRNWKTANELINIAERISKI